ncbi:MAG: HlyD family type I secretion periplasmic adaptor subunit [Sulfurimonas sp.]|nr:HlyD family type I secretion periplasmic adaptor subunit [Sulfurimonas sp.]
MQLFYTKDRHEFKPLLVEIEDRPLNPLGRALLWVIIAFIFFGSLWLFLAKIDIVVSARGKIIPYGEIKVLQPIETGVISRILVKEGAFVKQGEVLIEIDPSVTITNLESKQKNMELLKIEMQRLKALIENKPFIQEKQIANNSILDMQNLIYEATKTAHIQQKNLISQQILQVQEQIKVFDVDKNRLKQHLVSLNEREKRMQSILDIIASNEYENVRKELVEYEEQMRMKDHEIIRLQEQLHELDEKKLLLTQEYHNKLLEELTQKSKEVRLLEVEIESIAFQKAKQLITSPVDGYVAKLMVHTIGGIVTPAEKLVSIVPKDMPLVIKATVLNQDRGFVKKQMEAAIKIDTFDFQKYGLIPATVEHIADDAIEDEKLGAVYEVYLTPHKENLAVDGEIIALTSGMSVTAELKVGKRRVIEFFIYPLIKYLDEGMSVR